MAITSESHTHWEGSLAEGHGQTRLQSSGAATFDVTWAARSTGETGTTNPEELLGAAHSACYSMALSHALGGAGYTPDSLDVTAAVTFVPGEGVTGSHLLLVASIPGLSEDEFHRFAEEAKAGCPISQALAGVPITLEASLT
ncbi:OsmC family peroxiredoxin [Pontimonas sp.]|jgi:osmotically inducible protein OsmC|uniref:OsmC family peroxiredoxin n=1 Tax=Pontimonas sp. TaxID=2304492 RepID=UPI002870851B|nr:OsmC family peroxiredoxin [Pontimonas sp.]MDR9396951.1 OsmC family peroxiredoxin [Pontimonas sp.]MDR9434891.1 OsmC family peroxiredoxin [Pontimonas sp.]